MHLGSNRYGAPRSRVQLRPSKCHEFGRGRDKPVIVTRRNELPLLSLSGVSSCVTEKLESVTEGVYHWGNVGRSLAVLGGEKCSEYSVVLHPTIKH